MKNENQNPIPQHWVFIRGLTRGKFHWKNFISDFQQKLPVESVQCVELPGNGLLAAEPCPEKIEDAVKSLRGQLNHIEGRTYGIAGVSLGGMLATRWAQLEPELFSHMVLINSSSSLSPFYKRLMPKNYLGILGLLMKPNVESVEEFILRVSSNSEENIKKNLAENIQFIKENPISIRNFIKQLQLTGQIDFKNAPKAKKLVLASKADQLVDSSCSETIAKTWNCPIYFHESGGHDLSLDAGDWIIKVLNDEFFRHPQQAN